MSADFETPQDVEDAFYDALDESDLDTMTSVWDNSDDVICLVPMAPARVGLEQVIQGWQPLMSSGVKIDVEVRHVHWTEMDNLAIHLVEERISVPGQNQKQVPMYATNIYRRGEAGWRMIVHQNAPTPPPPGMMPTGMG